ATGNAGATYAIAQNTLAANSNYSVTYVPANVTMVAAPLTITATATNMTYGATSLPSLAYTYSALANGNTNTIFSGALSTNATVYAAGTSATGNAGATYAIAQNTLAANSNYSVTYVPANVTITARPITITADSNQTKIYGNLDPTLTYTVQANAINSGLVGSDTFAGTLSRTAGENVSNYAINQGNLANSNYNITFVPSNFAITARPITLTASAATKVYGEVDPSLAVTIAAGSLASAAVTDSLANVTGTLSRSVGENVGNYNILLGTGSSASNYAITYNSANQAMAITPASLTITGTQVYNGTVSIAGSSLSAIGVNGQTFTVGGVADLASKNVQTNQQLLDVNGLTLIPNGLALASNYNPISFTSTSVSVTPLAVTLTAPSISKVYDGGYTYNMTAANLAAMSTQLVGGDTVSAASVVFTGNNPNVGANKSVSLNSATISDGNSGANYSVSLANSNNSQITPASLSVTANNAAKFVTQADTALYNGVVYSGFVNGETASSALSGTLGISRANAPVNTAGAYSGVLVPSGLSANNGNYNITYVPGNFTIVAANQLFVQITPVTASYGSTPTYATTAQYLTCSISSCPSTGSVNTIHTLSPVISGTSFTVNDGAGGLAAFIITPAATTVSGSGNINVGGYQLLATNVNIVSNDFSNNIVLTGALTVTPLMLSASQLGISGISKVYNGTSAISGLTLATTQASSSILSGDRVSIAGTGTYADANVGTNKAVTIAVGLSGADANNYVLSDNQLIANIGAITQLASVTYTGSSGGNWSNASNWAGGAIPTLSNVANVIIPTGISVNYDSAALVGLIPTSTITNNGVIAFAGSNNFTFSNAVSGSGSLNQSGAGVLTVAGNNTFSGGTNINSSSLVIASVNALGTGAVTSNGGTLSLATGVTIPVLTVNGVIILGSDINTVGNQTYNGSVILGSGNTVGGTISPMLLNSSAGNIAFNGTLLAGASSYANQQSLSIAAPNGEVTFGDTVGASIINSGGQYIGYSSAYFNSPNIYNLNVAANTILIKGNITTFGTQDYTGHVLIGDNGSNGMTRILLSEDPSVIFHGAIDDTVVNTHNLIVEAIATASSQLPVIAFDAPVGVSEALASLTVKTGLQNTGAGAVIADTSIDPANFSGNITIASSVSTGGNQSYTANTIGLGNNLANDTQILSTNGGVITFNLGAPANGGSIAPYNATNYALNLVLNGGSVVGLANSGINYQMIVPPQVIAQQAIPQAVRYSAPPPLQAIAANAANVSAGELISYSSNIGGAGGSISVSAPVVESINPTASQGIGSGIFSSITSSLGSASSAVTSTNAGSSTYAQIQMGNGSVQTIQSSPVQGSGFAFTIPQSVLNSIATPAEAISSNSNSSSGISIAVTLADGSPLPTWLKFDANTITFSSEKVPENVSSVRVKLRVSEGVGRVGESEMTIIPANK
ncbi:autotransporter-associated beta strand protein, partial [Polynucleobacter sphagniphilus]|uniref:beta strand repeat-containing protein n=1 Tax=Polynucleobacter sphagniphilus TaxID=1743169 RepID=UPI0024744833